MSAMIESLMLESDGLGWIPVLIFSVTFMSYLYCRSFLTCNVRIIIVPHSAIERSIFKVFRRVPGYNIK